MSPGAAPRDARRLPLAPRLSKSKFTAGLQCHRALWWKVHEPDAAELAVDPTTQAVFDQGARVGEIARTYVPGGQLIDLPHWAVDERIEATRRALADGANVLYEASFRQDNVYVAVDILHRRSVRSGWTLTEVKSTTKVKDEHVPDAAVQVHVLGRAGLSVGRVEIMHLNRECRHPDLSNLFTRSDVTGPANAYLPKVPRGVSAQLRMLARPAPPMVEPGEHCSEPYECPFMSRCWPEAPAHSIGTLYKISPKKRDALMEEGYATIFDLPDHLDLGPILERQRRAVRSGALVVEDGLREALASLASPVAHLDFETISPAIPVWAGCRPYDQVPVQFSVHVEETRGHEARHHEWLAHGPNDPREALARALVDALRGARTIVVYHAPFEIERLRELQLAVPGLAADLENVITRIVDLLPIVRAHVYHPDFGGSFSLKKVAPALVPGLTYDGMEIGDGGVATQALETLLLRGSTLAAADTERLRKALLTYCEQDTLATIGVLQRLRAAVERKELVPAGRSDGPQPSTRCQSGSRG